MNPRHLIPCLLAAVATLAAPAAFAEGDEFQISRYGGRLGFSSEPDQFTLGAYAQLGELAPNLSLRPSVDFGFGSDIFSIIGNGDLQYSFVTGSQFAPFAGGGIALAYYSFDVPEGVDVDSSETEIGINVYGGVEFDLGDYKSAYAEARIGVDEMPDFKLTLGFGFY
jgi:hypothetical protein